MQPPKSQRVGFIGAGRLAASLASALHVAGYCVAAVASAREESARRLAGSIGSPMLVGRAEDVARRCDLVFLTVPDAAIEGLASSIEWRHGQAVVHCSGALGLEVLASAAVRETSIGCLHPLQSFPSREGDPTRFRDITCGIEANGALSATLETMVADLGAETVRLEGVDRARYHVAAVLASNDVVALMVAAVRVWEQAGLPREAARGALAPLLLGAAENIADRDLREALTGPIARGDVATVRRHLEALDEPALRELYRRLGVELLRLDLPASPEIAATMRALLEADR
jgi:predicted short-subunit dehydrogenase-like oxidoreductase (DUF2520 family)